MRFSRRQMGVVIACVAIYTTAYLNRLNLSAVLGSLTDELEITSAQAGLLQTFFAAVYAAGQFVNGAVVDRVNPRKYLLAGLAGTAVCNALMGMSVSYGMLLSLCLLNGAFQSMLWTPIVRMLALCFTDQAQREKANMSMSLTLVLGHLGAWGLSGWMSGLISWRWSFIAPAMVAVPVAAAAMLLLPKADKPSAQHREEKQQPREPLGHLFASTGFYLVLLSCVLYGFVKDGVVTWAPTLLQRQSGGNTLDSTAFSLLIPLINTVGIAMGYLLKRRSSLPHRRVIGVMMFAGAVFTLPLLLSGHVLVTALLLGCVCACMYGLNPMLTAILPMEYDRAGRIGLTAGLIDSLIYVGSALAGVAAGALYGGMGASALYVSWMICACLAAAAMLRSIRKKA